MTEADLLQGVIGYASSGGLYFSIWLTVLGPQGYLWVKSSSFDRRTSCGQTVDFTPPSLAA
jgi:hypothetical protein